MKKLILLSFVLFTVSLFSQYKDGEYYGSAQGYEGPIKVKTIVINGKISKIEILKQNESLALTSFEDVPKSIIESQKLNVDTVSGATITSKAIIKAVKNSLNKKVALRKVAKKVNSKKVIKLNKPNFKSNKKLMYALLNRKTTRSYSTKELSKQLLSEVLWASSGINRKEQKKITAPSAFNNQEIDVYVALKTGLYIYNRINHSLDLVLNKDIREHTGKRSYTKITPLNLIYVADYNKMKRVPDNKKESYSSIATGFISQNVYLYCAANDLASGAMGGIDKENLRKIMKLNKNQKIILTQLVGFKK